MRNKKRWTGIVTALVVGAMCLGGIGNATVQAYFNRGTVGVSVGKGTVSVEAGSNTSVSVSLTPASDSQLEGCGMAECPQICGEKDCLDANGQCTCNGKTYKTYNTSVSVSSSNTSVATASYSSGTLTVHGVSEGTAVITLTASLRQFSSGTTSVTVDVSKKPSSNDNNNSSGNDNNNSSGNNNSSSGSHNTSNGNNTSSSTSGNTNSSSSSSSGNKDNSATANQVGGTTTSEEETAEEVTEEENADGVTVVESDRGTITFVPIKEGKMGSDYLEAIKGKEKEYVDFQEKDDAGNILYAWEFLGTDVKNVFDMDFSVTSSKTAFDGCKLFRDVQALYLRFAHDGKLPGKAKVFIKVPEDMKNGSKWYLYHYDSKKETAEELAKELVVENGYITIELDECYDCVLSEKEISAKEEKVTTTTNEVKDEPEEISSNSSMIYVIVAVIVVLAAGAWLLISKKKKQNETTDAVSEKTAEEATELTPENKMEETAELAPESKVEETAELVKEDKTENNEAE